MIRTLLRPATFGLVLLVTALVPASAVRVQSQAGTPGVAAIRNATILTVTRGTINNGVDDRKH